MQEEIMPSIAMHFVQSDIILKNGLVEINDTPAFKRGMIMPDLVGANKIKSHHYKLGGREGEVPDIYDYARDNAHLFGQTEKFGELVHMCADYEFVNYVNAIRNVMGHVNKNSLYDDYRATQAQMLADFGVSITEINKTLKECKPNSNATVFGNEWNNINTPTQPAPTKIMTYEKLKTFLIEKTPEIITHAKLIVKHGAQNIHLVQLPYTPPEHVVAVPD